MLNGLDLFSGIGGIALALRGRVRVRAYCEIDRYAQAVLLSRMGCGDLPWAPIWDDVRTLTRDMLPGIDIITAGFPCQDISTAGNGAGLEGERSGLFFEVARLVGEIRPAFVFLENVPAIRTRGADVVAGRLADLGYDCRWITLSAAAVGAPHIRERWWLLAHADCERGREKQFPEQELEGPSDAHDHGTPKLVADSMREGLETRGEDIGAQSQHTEPADSGWWAVEPNVVRVVHGLPIELDALRRLGIPMAYESEEGEMIEAVNRAQSNPKTSQPFWEIMRAVWCHRETAKTSPYVYAGLICDLVPGMSQERARKRGNMGAWFAQDGELRDLWERFCSEGFPPSQDVQSKLFKRIRKIECEKTVGVNRVDRIKALGNSVVPFCARTAFERLLGVEGGMPPRILGRGVMRGVTD